MMFFKLFKYDFKASARFGVPILIAIAAAGLLETINTAITVGNVGKETTFEAVTNAPFGEMLIFFGMGGLLLSGLVFAAAWAVMSVMLLVQYYRTTAGEEAYLTFTLPVTPAQILWSKLANTLVWSVFCGLAMFLAGAAILGTGVTMAGIAEDFVNTFGELFAFLYSIFGRMGTVFLLCLNGAASVVASYLMMFMAITFGSVIVRKHKALMAVVMMFVIHFIMSGITGVMKFILLGDFTFKMLFAEGVTNINSYLISCTVLYAALSAVYFLVTRWMMEKKLNLD